ncbi:MAG: hypothetical protein KKI02_06575 [Planctomycetes bacterium]|nr:hypothetical protein [Planctomycetota bacterium]
MCPRKGLILAVAASVQFAALCGCVLGPAALEASRLRYNNVIQETTNEQLLLNLVRLQYREAPLFLEVGSVSAQFSFQGGADVAAAINEGPNPINPDALDLGAGVGYEESPTVTFTPLQGEDFVNRILSPLPLDVLVLLSRSGWSIDRVLRVTVQQMNGLDNASRASGPTPKDPPRYEEFARVTQAFRSLQKKGLLELGYETREADLPLSFAADSVSLPDAVDTISQGYGLRRSEDSERLILTSTARALVWRLTPATKETAEVAEIVQLLGLDPGLDTYEIRLGQAPQATAPGTAGHAAQITVMTRSMMGLLFYLSQAVEVPQPHRAQGWVTTTVDAQGQPFDWSRVTGDLLQVHVRATPPRHPAAAVRYLGYWYYIDNADLTSKSTFGLLSQLFALQAGEAKGVTPVLTLPIGG